MNKKIFNTMDTKGLKGEKHKGRKKDKTVFGVLALILFLSACQTTPMPVDTPTQTSTFSPSATMTATATFTPSPTSLPTFTPEPSWYQAVDPALGVLKYQYAEVLNKRAKVYASLKDAEGKTGNYGYLPKFPAYVAATSSQAGADGHTYYLVSYGWMDEKDLQPLTSSGFTGILLRRAVTFRFGWLLADSQSVNAAGEPVQTYKRYQVVHEAATDSQKAGYLAIGADEWLPEEALALINPAVPADAGQNTCRFIYANLKTQILSVYDQCKLVFATLISSGKNSWTFEGRFAILNKNEPYSSITPPVESTSEYYIEGVPYFMSYAGNFGFHGAYWHDNFGSAASHGCINLAPADAKWLYDWAGIGERVIISSGE